MRRLLIAVMILQTGAFAQGVGVTVSGRVTPAPGTVAASLNALRVVIVPSGYPPKTMEAAVQADGTFQFSKVPGGPYIVRLLTGTASAQLDTPNPTQAIFVGSQDIGGIEISGPRIIAGKAVVQGGGALPLALGATASGAAASETLALGRIEARAAAFAQEPQRGGQPLNAIRTADSQSFRSDGAFALALFPGEYRVSVTGLPAGYTVRSISYGTADMLQEPLKVAGSSSQDIRVTLTHAPGFSVRGRVIGIPSGNLPPGVAVTTPGSGTPVNADGTFELLGVPPGSRAITLTRNGVSFLSGQFARSQLSTANITVVDRDIDGVLLQWTPLTPISGTFVTLDKTGGVVAGVPPNAVVTLTSRDGKPLAGGCDYQGCRADILTLAPTPDGSLSAAYPLLIPAGESDVRIERLPPGYVVISLSADRVDLLKEPLMITTSTPAADIQAVVQNTSGARVSGRVAASNMSHLFPQRVTLRATPGFQRGATAGLPPTWQSIVESNGTFEFHGIPAGTYSLITNPDGSLAFGSTTSNIVVTDRDLDEVPIIGLSDVFVPNSEQAANEAAAILNLTTIQRLQIYYNSSMRRYGTIPDLVAAGLLSPAYSGAISGFTLSVSATESDFVISAIPASTGTGRYEFYYSRTGGSRALKVAGSPSANRALTRDTRGQLSAADGIPMEPVGGCGVDVPLCLRYGQMGGVPLPTLRGRVSIVDGPRGGSTLPAGLYVGAASTDGAGNLTALGSDGLFQVQLFSKPGEYRVVVQNLPAEYTLKSITSGGIEIPNGLFKTAANGASPELFEIVLTSSPR